MRLPWNAHTLLASLLVMVACSLQDDALAPRPPTPPNAQLDTFLVRGTLAGRVTRSGPETYSEIIVYGYFAGDTIAQRLARTGADALGDYAASIHHQLIVRRDTATAGLRRKWRALVVEAPFPVRRTAATLAIGNWVERLAGDTTSLGLMLNFDPTPHGVLPAKPPVMIPTGLPERSAAVDLSAVSDSVREFGADVFVKITGVRTEPYEHSGIPPAIVLLADAGLLIPTAHGRHLFFAELGPRWDQIRSYTIWGRIPPNARGQRSAVDRIAALPFVEAITPLTMRIGDEPITSFPSLDSAPLRGASDEVTMLYKERGKCFLDDPAADEASWFDCGKWLLGMKAGVGSSQLLPDINAVGGRIVHETSWVLYPDGQRYVIVEVPLGSERRAFAIFQRNPLLRYVSWG